MMRHGVQPYSLITDCSRSAEQLTAARLFFGFPAAERRQFDGVNGHSGNDARLVSQSILGPSRHAMLHSRSFKYCSFMAMT